MSDSKKTVDKKLELMQKVSGIADELALGYVERLRKTINDLDGEQKSINPHEMDRVLRIAKQYSDRVLLAEGKATENIGVGGSGGMPFNVVFTKTYETKQVEETTDNNDRDN